jgi:hypothetical protein
MDEVNCTFTLMKTGMRTFEDPGTDEKDIKVNLKK